MLFFDQWSHDQPVYIYIDYNSVLSVLTDHGLELGSISVGWVEAAEAAVVAQVRDKSRPRTRCDDTGNHGTSGS
jgi:hypothetical protein